LQRGRGPVMRFGRIWVVSLIINGLRARRRMALSVLQRWCGGAIRRRRHGGGGPWPWYGALTASALEPTNGGERRAKGTDTKFPAQFAGNWLSVPGFALRETPRLVVSLKTDRRSEEHTSDIQ